MRSLLPGILILVFPVVLRASFSFTPSCRQAYQLVWDYRLTDSRQLIQKIRYSQPENRIADYLQESAAFLKAFVSEENADQQAYQSSFDNLFSSLGKETSRSPWQYFIKAEAYMHICLLHLKKTEYLTAAYDISKAYGQLESCNTKYPAFLPAQKDLFALQAAIGSIPDNYRWMIRIMGFNGNLKQSMAAYEKLLDKMASDTAYKIFLPETQVLYSYLELYLLNQTDKAWKDMQQATSGYKTSPVFAYLRASMALHIKNNDAAIEAVSSLTRDLPAIPHLDYQLGTAKLQKGDHDAGFYLARFLREYKGQNYIKDAYLRLGWAFLLNGDEKGYKDCMKLAQMSGTENIEEDVNAMKEASRTDMPSVPLLRARLCYDGGYFSKAKGILQEIKIGSLNTYSQMEYYYREGRVAEALNQYDEALGYYGKLINNFKNKEGYFIPAACVYCGMIWEKKDNPQKARYYYQKALTYKDYPYKNSFDQKAQSGLRRLEQ